jgi:hypothetical protein
MKNQPAMALGIYFYNRGVNAAEQPRIRDDINQGAFPRAITRTHHSPPVVHGYSTDQQDFKATACSSVQASESCREYP